MKNKLQPLLYKMVKWHYRKPRKLTKRGIEFILQPTVFHPNYYLSTDYLLDFILTKNLTKKNVLELGCGSGFVSMYLSKETEAHCYASDINPQAVSGLRSNASNLGLDLMVVESNLFDKLGSLPPLDYILVNPPYFQKEVKSVDEYAINTGANHGYFRHFFLQIKDHLNKATTVFFILSENVKLEEIQEIASQHGVGWKEVDSKIINEERFMILELGLL